MTEDAKEEENSEHQGGLKHKHGGMGRRGVTRTATGYKRDQRDEGQTEEESNKQRWQMLHQHHKQSLWVYWTLIMLGIWMVLSPLTFSYGIGTVEPSGGRSVWLSLSERITILTWSDIISGLLLIIFGWRSLTPNRPASLWICCFVGIWISMAPLLFWSPTAVAYLNATLVGVWVIALTVLIPGIPNMILFIKKGSQFPQGWSYNPSSWPQRWILIVMGFLGWMASRYLGAYQLGYIDYAWDPFFGNATVEVLDSDLSHSWPVSDAAFGSLAYTFEFLMGFIGGTSRWRTMPWMVVVFGILVVPLGLVSIFLVISQPLTVVAWCTICLVTAIFMLPMIPLEIDEVIATVYDLVQRKRRGEAIWHVFWKGSSTPEIKVDERSPELIDLPHNFSKVFRASIWGISFPWTLTLSAALGIWLMFGPSVFGVSIETTAADLNHLFGAIITVIAVVSMAEVTRIVRYINIISGLAIAIIPWFLQDIQTGLFISGTITGLAVIFLSLPRGRKKEDYGFWEPYIK